MNIGDVVEIPCKKCAADPGVCPCRVPRSYATVTAVGRRLVTVRLHNPPARWRERGLSEHMKYGFKRLKVIARLAENSHTRAARQAVVEFDDRRKQGYLEALERMRNKPRSAESIAVIDRLAKEIQAG